MFSFVLTFPRKVPLAFPSEIFLPSSQSLRFLFKETSCSLSEAPSFLPLSPHLPYRELPNFPLKGIYCFPFSPHLLTKKALISGHIAISPRLGADVTKVENTGTAPKKRRYRYVPTASRPITQATPTNKKNRFSQCSRPCMARLRKTVRTCM